MGLPTIFERPIRTEHQHAACGRAGHERIRGIAGRKLADVNVMKAIDVLRRCDRLRYPLFVQVIGQRQLHENAVDTLILIERRDEIEHVLLGHVDGQRVPDRMEAASFRRALLVSYVYLARRVLTDDDHCKARLDAVIARQRRRFFRDLFRQFGRLCLAVDTNCTGHEYCSCTSKARAW
jgi:hypothetical protein